MLPKKPKTCVRRCEEVNTGAIAVESPPDSVISISKDSDGLLKAIDRLSPVDLEIHGNSLGLDCSDSVYVVQIWKPVFGAANTMTTPFRNLLKGWR